MTKVWEAKYTRCGIADFWYFRENYDGFLWRLCTEGVNSRFPDSRGSNTVWLELHDSPKLKALCVTIASGDVSCTGNAWSYVRMRDGTPLVSSGAKLPSGIEYNRPYWLLCYVEDNS